MYNVSCKSGSYLNRLCIAQTIIFLMMFHYNSAPVCSQIGNTVHTNPFTKFKDTELF